MGQQVIEVEVSDEVAARTTLYAASTDGNVLLVSPTSISVYHDLASASSIAINMEGGEEIIAAQSTGDLVAAAKRGGELVIFQYTGQALDKLV